MPAKRSLLVLLAVTALIGILVALRVPVTYPMPGYGADMVQWAATGRISDTFTPLAYPLFAALGFRVAGIHGVLALQVLLQIGIVRVGYLILRQLRLPAGYSALGALPLALDPELFLSVSKVWDLALSTFLLLLFVLVCLDLLHRAPRLELRHTLAAGLVFAAAIFCRPNLILLLPVILALLLCRRPGLSRARLGADVVAFLVIAAGTFSLLGIASHGSAFFPHNGPYNLYAGHNPETMTTLLHELNAENSIGVDIVRLKGPVTVDELYSPAMGSFYTRQSIHFALHHPGVEVELVLVKLFTLFRPDTKVHRLLSGPGLVKALLAAPAFLFLAALLLHRRGPFSLEDRMLFATEILYILPFLLTNSDPRFCIPLEALFLLHLVSLLYWRRNPQLCAGPAAL